MWNSTSTDPCVRYSDTDLLTNTPKTKTRTRQKSAIVPAKQVGLPALGQGDGRPSIVLVVLVGAVLATFLDIFAGSNTTAPAPKIGKGSVAEVPQAEAKPKKKRKPPTTADNIPPATAQEYIEKYAPIAVREMHKYGIPASITLAQGLLESTAGTSNLALATNNHFGIKCFSKNCKPGHCANFKDDTHKDFFRIYPNPVDSYRAHSEFLKKSSRYRDCFRQGRDFRGWAIELENAGYATDPRYAEGLIERVNHFNLDRFDR